MQESKYKRINTESLFEEFKLELQNLEITEKGLHLKTRRVYKPREEILSDPDLELKDVDVDECYTIFLLDRKSMSILVRHREVKNLRFPSYSPGVLAPFVEEPEGLAVDKDFVYIIGTFKVREMERKEGLVALSKKDLRVIWSVLKGPDGVPLKGLTDIAKDSDGDLYVLEKGRHRILKLSPSSREKSFSEIGRKELYKPVNLYFDEKGALHVFDEKTGYLVFGKDGSVKNKEITPSILELIRRRKAHDLKKNMYVISEDNTGLRFLEYIEEKSPDKEGIFKGTYFSRHIDSHIRENGWYRFLLEGKIPIGTTVEFSYYISDELLDAQKLKEFPDEKWIKGLSGSSVVQGEEKRDALFITEKIGQYLWFKMTLIGTEKLSPVISSVTVFFPKVSYMDYLPSVYREDTVNRDFLDRFLTIFESLFFEVDCTIDHLSRWFDAAGTPLEFIEWLGGWIGAAQGIEGRAGIKKVPEAKQREFITRAVSMYKDRGARKGLENLIDFYTGKKPIIVENFPVYCTKGNNEDEKRSFNQNNADWRGSFSQKNKNLKKNEISEQKKYLFYPPELALVKFPDRKNADKKGIPLQEVLFGKENFSFFVFFEEKLEEAELELILNIIEEEKPAHTTYKLKTLERGFYLDGHTYLEVNTELKRPEFLLEKSSVLGRDTALGVANRFDFLENCQETGIMLIRSDPVTSGKNQGYFDRRFGHGRI